MDGLYQRLLGFTRDGVYRYVFDDGRILMANRGFVHLMGLECDPGELVGKRLRDLMVYTEREGTVRNALEATGEIHGFEYHFRTLGGEDRWVIHDSFLAVDDETGLRVVDAIVKDITERKLAEIALREREARLAAMLTALPDMLFRLDADDVFVDFHANDPAHLAAPPEAFLGRRLDAVLPEPAAGLAIGAARRARESGALQVYEFPLTVGEGPRDYEGRVVPVGNGEAVFIVRDITERKHAEDAILAERERLLVTLRSIGDGVITTDREGRVVLVNRVAEGLTGWTQAQAEGRPLAEVFHIISERTRQRCENPVERVLATGGIVGLANGTLLVARDGTERVIADSGAPIRDPASRIIGVVLVFRDQTEHHLLEEEAKKAQRLESLGILAGGIAHDFNNLLTGISGNVSLARMILAPLEPAALRLAEAEKAVTRARDLTQQLLTFSKGGAPVRKAASIGELILDTVGFALTGSDVRCEMSIPPDLWPVEVDEGQISQVLHNLILNADQAMPAGGIVRLFAENLEIGGDHPFPVRAGRYVRIAVEDSGVGIHPDHLSRIFDPYFTTKQKGSGLGLSISYSIIRKHSGYIFVKSELGRGSRFYVYLPAGARSPERPLDGGRTIPRGQGRILVMDDEEIVVNVAEAMLQHLGYEVEIARDGVLAIAAWQRARDEGRPFDAALADLTVPGGMGGVDMVHRLHETDPGARVVVSSGYSSDPVMSRFEACGFCGVVTKPYRMEDLAQVIDAAVRGGRTGPTPAGTG